MHRKDVVQIPPLQVSSMPLPPNYVLFSGNLHKLVESSHQWGSSVSRCRFTSWIFRCHLKLDFFLGSWKSCQWCSIEDSWEVHTRWDTSNKERTKFRLSQCMFLCARTFSRVGGVESVYNPRHWQTLANTLQKQACLPIFTLSFWFYFPPDSPRLSTCVH